MKKDELRGLQPPDKSNGDLAVRQAVPVLAVPELPPDDFSLRDIVGVFRAHLPLFLGTLLSVLGIGLALALTTPPSYESTAVINLEDNTSFVDTEKMLGGEVPGISRDGSMLESMPLAIRVLKRLRAENRLADAGADADGERIDSIPAKQIKRFRKRLRVEHTPGSSVYAITYKDTNPEYAARVVNLVVDEFRGMKSELLMRRFNTVRDSINQEAARLRDEVRRAEQRVADYKKAHGLSDSIGISLKIRQVGDLNAELRQARAELRDLEANWKRVSSLARAGDTAAMATVVASPLVQSLRDKQVALKARIRELEQEYGKRHPVMTDARAQLEEVDASIRREIALLVRNIRDDVRAQEQKVETLKADIARMEEEIVRGQAAQVELQDLEREAASSRRVLEKFLVAEKQHSISARNQMTLSNPITVISRGFVPVESVFPNARHIMVLTGIAAPILATMMVFFAEHLNPRARRRKLQALAAAGPAATAGTTTADGDEEDATEAAPEEPGQVRFIDEAVAEQRPEALAIPVPGDGTTIVPATEMVGKMQSRFSQAIAQLNSMLRRRLGARDPSVTVITSVGRRGDKVSIASALAALDAAEGKKVILVDMSLGEAELHRAFALEPVPGMAEVMRKKVSLLKAFQTDYRTHVSLFTRGAPLTEVERAKLLEAAPSLFRLLRRYFDRIYVVVRDVDGASPHELLTDVADQYLLVVEQNQGQHVKLSSMLMRTTLAPAKDKMVPVYVARQVAQ